MAEGPTARLGEGGSTMLAKQLQPPASFWAVWSQNVSKGTLSDLIWTVSLGFGRGSHSRSFCLLYYRCCCSSSFALKSKVCEGQQFWVPWLYDVFGRTIHSTFCSATDKASAQKMASPKNNCYQLNNNKVHNRYLGVILRRTLHLCGQTVGGQCEAMKF